VQELEEESSDQVGSKEQEEVIEKLRKKN